MHSSHARPLSHVIALIALAFTCSHSAPAAQGPAADRPARPVRIIVPYTPGGGTDIVGCPTIPIATLYRYRFSPTSFVLAANPSVPVKNVKELIALAKAWPGQLTYGSTTLGGGPHLAGELVQSMSGIRWSHVPFKGAGPAAIALMSGEIDFMFASTAALLGGVRSGKMRAIAVTGSKRMRQDEHVSLRGTR